MALKRKKSNYILQLYISIIVPTASKANIVSPIQPHIAKSWYWSLLRRVSPYKFHYKFHSFDRTAKPHPLSSNGLICSLYACVTSVWFRGSVCTFCHRAS